jgi:hypothetical protein
MGNEVQKPFSIKTSNLDEYLHSCKIKTSLGFEVITAVILKRLSSGM